MASFLARTWPGLQHTERLMSESGPADEKDLQQISVIYNDAIVKYNWPGDHSI